MSNTPNSLRISNKPPVAIQQCQKRSRICQMCPSFRGVISEATLTYPDTIVSCASQAGCCGQNTPQSVSLLLGFCPEARF